MIYSLGRHGAVQRSLIHAARCRAPLSSPRVAPYTVRFASDVRARTDATPKAEPAAPPPATPRKHKVGLHPAPVKPSPSTSSSERKPPPALSEKPHASSTVARSSSPDTRQERKKESLFQMTQADLNDAEARGILKPPPEGAGTVKRFTHKAWELIKFYARGGRDVYSNWVFARELKSRYDPLPRRYARLIARSYRDIVKLIPFVLVVLIAEEAIPLIVLYAPWMLPSTCVLPAQRARIERKRREKQADFAAAMAHELRGVLDAGGALPIRDPRQLIALCGMLSLNSFGIPSMRMSRIERHLRKIIEDDTRLKAEGDGADLVEVELYEALEERGLLTIGLERQTARTRLNWWLREVDGADGADGVARRVQLIARSALDRF